jgi:gramicidin S biosynthesis grsT protein
MKEEIILYCFPYAGASASFYLGWAAQLDKRIKIVPVEYPGRGSRFGEILCNDMDDMVEAVLTVIIKNGTENCAFFGHSLGGLVAYETTLKLREMGMKLPKHMFLSGCTPPHVKYGDKMLHLLLDDEFLKELVELGGMSEDILNNREILELYLPVIRADYRIYELYKYKSMQEPLPVDYTVLTGNTDIIAGGRCMMDWKLYTSEKFQIRHFEGNHFFIHEQTGILMETIEEQL